MTKKEFVVFLSITCFVIIVWIIADILHAKADTPLPSKLQQVLEPLNPTFDQDTLEKIKGKSAEEANFFSNQDLNVSITPSVAQDNGNPTSETGE